MTTQDQIELYQIKGGDVKLLLPKVDKFKQWMRIRGMIMHADSLNFVFFTDSEINPTIIMGIDCIRGQFNLFTCDINRFTLFVKSINWKRGFLYNSKLNLDILNYPFMKDGLIDHLLPEERIITFASLGLEEHDIIEKVLIEQGFTVDINPEIYDLLVLPIDSLEDTLKILREKCNGQESSIKEIEAEIVDSNWPYRSSKSINFLKWATKHSNTSCIRVDDEIASWIIQYTDGSIGSLFTIPKHRGNGFAIQVVADILIKSLSIASPHTPFIYIKTDNIASQNLFRNLGFRSITLTKWLTVLNIPTNNHA